MNTQRDNDGRYSNGLDAVCRCGHTKGTHLAAGARECIVHEVAEGIAYCECKGFKKAKVTK